MMKRVAIITLVLLAATMAAPASAQKRPAVRKPAKAAPTPPSAPRAGRAWGAPAVLSKPNAPAARQPKVAAEDNTPAPAAGDPDRERIERLQEALDNIIHGPVLGRLRVGVRVM